MNTVKKRVTTQFDLTNFMLNNLSQYDITPTAKLVLLYLTTCYNPNHADVFPKQKTIADKIGVSERSVVRAIQELFKAGLILIEYKYTNRYKIMPNMTSQLSQNDNLSLDECKNVTFTPDKLSHHEHEQTKRTNKQQTVFFNKGGNVYWASEQSARAERRHVYCERSLTGDDKILEEYAIKHGAKNIKAYIAKLKETKSAEKIIKEYKKTGCRYSEKRTDLLRDIREQQKQNRIAPENCAAWVEFGKKIKTLR